MSAANAPVAGQTLAAMAAVNFWVVLRQVGDTTGRDHAAGELFGHRFAQMLLCAVKRGWFEKFPVGNLLSAFGLAGDAHKGFHSVVPRLTIGVTHGPVAGAPFLSVGL